jgi:FdhD protein
MNIKSFHIKKYKANVISNEEDYLAVEEPLEISLKYQDAQSTINKPISVTMRTPGNDPELAIGFLFTEGIIQNIQAVKAATPNIFDPNKICVELHEGYAPSIQHLDRNFYTTSSCGICGKSSIDAITIGVKYVSDVPLQFDTQLLCGLQDILLQHQQTFKKTGGIHASALFDVQGNFLAYREDVGRHNALDKLIGWACEQNMLPLQQQILLLSGRASFELIQKAAMAGIRAVAAVGAPSSLAVETAKHFNMQLFGFVKSDKFNQYN